MIAFAKLLVDRASNSRSESSMERRFHDAVAGSHLHLWSPGMPVANRGKRILIGVADYSVPDLRLLDLVNDAIAPQNGCDVRWEVFNTIECQRPEAFEQYIPGLRDVFQTPVVGVWEHGILTEKAWGKPARALILQTCGLNPDVESTLFS